MIDKTHVGGGCARMVEGMALVSARIDAGEGVLGRVTRVDEQRGEDTGGLYTSVVSFTVAFHVHGNAESFVRRMGAVKALGWARLTDMLKSSGYDPNLRGPGVADFVRGIRALANEVVREPVTIRADGYTCTIVRDEEASGR